MRVLVTGSEGYIGSVLVPLLVERGHDVAGFDTGYFAEARFLPLAASELTRRGDLREIEAKDLKGFDAIIHLGALSNDPWGQLNPELTQQINYECSVRLAKLAKQAGVARFLFSSSCSTYGAASQGGVVETDELNPLSAYAVAKVMAERDITPLADDRFAPTFLRNATVYGVSPRMRFDLVLNNLAGWAFTTGKIVIQSDGTPWRPLVHVRDVSAAFLAIMEAPREVVANQVFNIGQESENYQVRDLAAATEKEFPGSTVVYADQASTGDPRSYRVSFRKFWSAFPNLRFEWNAEKGLRELHEVFDRVGFTGDHFQHRDFIRLKQIEHLLETGALDHELRWTCALAAREA
jgi:nucleoside-diphosphate-sugar epimerase